MSTKNARKQVNNQGLLPKLRFPEFQAEQTWDLIPGHKLFEQVNNRQAPDGLPILAITQDHGAIPRDVINYHVSVTDDSVKSYKEVKPGDFIISLRSFQGGIEYSEYHGICSPAYVILRKKAELCDLFFRYLFKSYSFIQKLTRNLEGLRDGKMISYKQFSDLRLPYPNIAEQQKIADCLTSLDELIFAHQQKLDALKNHKKGLQQQLFPRTSETLPRLRFPEFQNAVEWKCDTLNGIAEISSGSTPLRSNTEFYEDGSIPWVKTTDLNNSFITETEEKINPRTKARINPAGSVLVAMYGGFNQIGRTGCLSVPAATNQAISVLVINSEIVLPVYVMAWLNAKVDDWKRIASSSRKDPNITSTDVAKFRITYPKIPEQQRIADCLISLDELITAQSKKLETLTIQKKGLMQQLLSCPDERKT